MLSVVVVTEGDPERMSGGFLYHRRIAALAGDSDATVRFVSVPPRPYPLGALAGPAVMRSAAADADVVVVDSLASNTLGPLMARGLARRVGLVGSVHQVPGGMDHGRARRAVQARCDRLAWAACRRIVVPSDMLAAQLVTGGLRRDRISVVPPGRDVEPAPPPTSPTDLRGGRRAALLCVANWQPRKGIVELLEAVATLPADLASLHLVGDESVDPDYRRRVIDRLDRPDLVGRVVRHGIVAASGMGPLYDAADVFVLASTEEPYGMVYAEAMTAGLPVVGWAAGNLPNLVDDRVEGRVVPTGNTAALAAALDELGHDGALRARLGAAGRARAARLPTWDESAAAFFAVCHEVAAAAR